MRSLKSGLVTIALSCGIALAAVVGCSADGGGVDGLDPIETTDPTESPGTVLPPSSSSGGPAPVADAGSKNNKDAGKKADAGVDAGPPPPTPGSACTTVDDIATKICGKCGEASAICQTDNTWSVYGACEGETGECTPGETAACGNCGTKTCDQFCGWGPCMGEPANSCSPGETEQSTVGCPPQGNVKPYRTRACKTDCTWDNYSTTCFVPPSWDPVQIELVATQKAGRVATGTCPASSIATTQTPYVYTPITNPASAPVRVTIYHSAAPGGPTSLDTIIGVYNRSTPPTTDADRRACMGNIGDQSVASDPTGNNNFAIIRNIVIPAGGTVLVYSAGYYDTVVGKVMVNVKAE